MKLTVGLITSYVFGVALILVGALLTIQTPIGLVPLLVGLLITPPSRRRIEGRSGIELSRGLAAGVGVIGIVVAVAGMALLGAGSGTPGSQVSNVTVSGEDASASGAAAQLDVVWDTRAQASVDPDPDDATTYEANDGQKYLVLRVSVTNTGDESIDLRPSMFRIASDGTEYDYQALFGAGNSFGDVTLNPGGTHSGWLAFSIPEGTGSATLVVNQDAFLDRTVSVQFEHEPSMDIEMAA